MKYIIIDDLNSVYENKKLLFLLVGSPILYLIFIKFFLEEDFLSINNLYVILGGSFFVSNTYEYILLILNILIYSYLINYIVRKDLQCKVEYIFLRISKKEWLIYKIVSILIISFILAILNFLFILITVLMLSIKIKLSISFLQFFIIKMYLGIINIIFFLLFRNKSLIVTLMIYMLPVILNFCGVTLKISFMYICESINPFFNIIFLIFSIIIVLLLGIKKKGGKIYD